VGCEQRGCAVREAEGGHARSGLGEVRAKAREGLSEAMSRRGMA
jgi:hypothetical protein